MSTQYRRKWSDADIRNEPRLALIAIEYARNYDGCFEFLLSAKSRVRQEGTLSIGMARGVLNCMEQDARITMPSFPEPQPRQLYLPDVSVLQQDVEEDLDQTIEVEAIEEPPPPPTPVILTGRILSPYIFIASAGTYHIIAHEDGPQTVEFEHVDNLLKLSRINAHSACGMVNTNRRRWWGNDSDLKRVRFASREELASSFDLPEDAFRPRRLCKTCDKRYTVNN